MKKRAKAPEPAVPEKQGPDMAELIGKIQQQLAALDKKIDILVSRSSSSRPPETRPNPSNVQKPFQGNGHPQRSNDMKQENRFRERVLHKAICADCNKPCEVPFQPRPDRPVYCKECFSKRKSPNQFNVRPESGNKPKVDIVPTASHAVSHAAKAPAAEKVKPAEKKKPAAKRKKKRA